MDHPESNTAAAAEAVRYVKVGAGPEQTVWASEPLPSDSKGAEPPSRPLPHHPDRTFEVATPAIIEVTMPPVIEVAAVILPPLFSRAIIEWPAITIVYSAALNARWQA